MQSTEVSSIKVTIVGGGIGGLTAALALLQRGIDVDVCLSIKRPTPLRCRSPKVDES